MTLEEAIKHAEEIAEEQEGRGYCDRSVCVIMEGCDECEVVKCRECAKEHYQLAEWLKELQAHRYAWAKLREDIRDEAEFAYADFDEYKYEVLGIDDVDDLPNDDYRYGMERALELIDIYRPDGGDAK